MASRWVVNLKPAPQAEASGPVNRPFHRKIGFVFHSAVCTVPWVWCPAKNNLSNCFKPIGPSNTGPLVHQSAQGTSPVWLHVSAPFGGYTARDSLEQGMLTSASKLEGTKMASASAGARRGRSK